ncbi:hypothetical protein GGR91_000153 [Sphingorhabdus rigui]|uniref:Uncharacterized protein n=1 Tax=Sphingorhabdus rigui TaxID=1282858 RepID=A0A840AWF7_9SPHN|nr:hypothetical protein [Sphingorhabdus rigui]
MAPKARVGSAVGFSVVEHQIGDQKFQRALMEKQRAG